MTVLLYDGTWDGLLSAVFLAYNRENVTISKRGGMFFDYEQTEADDERVSRLTAGMARLGPEVPELVYRAFCAEYEGFEDDLLLSLRLGFKLGADPFSQRKYPFIERVAAAALKAGREAHRFLGLVRFVHAGNGLYVGDIGPDCNILPLIGGHFHDRFGDQRIILRDVNRRSAIISDTSGWWIAELDDMPPLPDDRAFEDMWAAYFRSIANPERVNKKLQRNFVPLKHRKHLPEFR